MKERLEKETAAHLEARQKISELEDRTSELEHRATYEQDERKRLETLIGNLPDDAKVCFILFNYRHFNVKNSKTEMLENKNCQNFSILF